MSTPSPETEPGRLNGWKEIALHLGKGTRTVQRWEKLYGLPVHRIGREGGEIVFAFRDEIDRWTAATEGQFKGNGAEAPDGEPPDAEATPDEGARPAGRRLGYRLALVIGATAVVGLVAVGWVFARFSGSPTTPRRSAAGQPAAWRMANESLTVFDSSGATLFEHPFGFAVPSSSSSDTVHAGDGSPPVLIADIDEDGRNEVLVKANARERANRRLYCLEADGRTRFVHQPTGTRRFGDDEYAEPWVIHRVFLTRGPSGSRRLWVVFTHNLWFPSVLQELDPHGAVRQEYWSNGFIELVAETSWNGRPVVLVGGTNNDFRAASLAVFPPDGVTGSAPAARPAYACRNCPAGGPGEVFLFPSLCATRRNGQAGVLEAWVEHGDRIRVTVIQDGGATYYTLGPGGSVLGAEISRELQSQHALLERQGVLDHPFGPTDDREMFPVRRWDGRRFVDLSRVPVAH
ncbi:MAG TPA: hypothetical protein VE359_17435 [Vicinamibacteria bacterium]|nr:hypothetical protein [Vicinamibacteria bacterium]